MRVALVDDDDEMRDARRAVLPEHPDIEVVGEVMDGRTAVEYVLKLGPSLVLMDVLMSGMGTRDIAELLDLSQQRVSQIARGTR